MHMNCYNYGQELSALPLKDKQIRNSLTTPNKMTTAGTILLKEQADIR